MFKKILLIVAVVVLVAVVVGLALPAKAEVDRGVLINRPASLVYATVNSFQLISKWSPLQELDPNMRQTIDGPREGAGAKLRWAGNFKVGRGTALITGGVANESVDSTLIFREATGYSHMNLVREGDATRVIWSMTLERGANPLNRYVGLVLDQMIGPDLDLGLGKLKKLVESMPDTDIAGLSAAPVELRASPVLLVTETAAYDGIGKAYVDGYQQIGRFIAKNRLRQSGAPLGIEGAATAASFSFDAGIPVDRADVVGDEGVRVDKTYTGKALKASYVGPYPGMQLIRDQLLAYAAAHGYVRSGAVFWSFLDEPMRSSEAPLRTEFYAPVE